MDAQEAVTPPRFALGSAKLADEAVKLYDGMDFENFGTISIRRILDESVDDGQPKDSGNAGVDGGSVAKLSLDGATGGKLEVNPFIVPLTNNLVRRRNCSRSTQAQPSQRLPAGSR